MADGDGAPRVLFAIGGLGVGGSETQLVEFVTQAHPTHVQATLVVLDGAVTSPLAARLERAGIPLLDLGTPGGRGLRAAVRRAIGCGGLLRTGEFDAVYAWLEETSLYFVPLGRALGVPTAVARRNIVGARAERNLVVRSGVRWAERLAQVVTANSDAVAQEARRRGIRGERVRVVPNGHVVRGALPAPPEPPVRIGYVAGFRTEKGHARLIRVLRLLGRSLDWTVDLAGEGPLLPAIRELVRRTELEDRVTFAGRVDDVRAFWRDRHIALLLSDHEGSPNALIEAALAGRPLVATAVGGTTEIVRDGTGIAVAGDAEAARALEWLIERPDAREQLGAGAHAWARERFGMGQSVRGHLDALRAAIG